MEDIGCFALYIWVSNKTFGRVVWLGKRQIFCFHTFFSKIETSDVCCVQWQVLCANSFGTRLYTVRGWNQAGQAARMICNFVYLLFCP